jgi:putative intracellular protease/amidase
MRDDLRYVGAVAASFGAAIAAVALIGCSSSEPLPPVETNPAVIERRAQEFVAALMPRRAGRPVIAILALNEGTETTDFLLPHAVLTRADVADVQPVAPRGGRVVLYPALQAEGVQALAAFDRAHPSGADYVIVPAMSDDNDPAVTDWLRRQAEQGARVIGVCVGALVLGRAGLLDGRRFSGHWYYRKQVLERHPGASYVPHQRYLIDRDVATTTGITASVPAMLALVEAIGGREKAQALAAETGVSSWTPAHDSTPFFINARRRWSFIANKIAFWRNERWGVDVRDGSDDITLALAADAWSRTGHVSIDAASASGPVKLRSGLVLFAQPVDEKTPRLPLAPGLNPMQQLDRTLCEIGQRYGASRREWVMLEMEYAGGATYCVQ